MLSGSTMTAQRQERLTWPTIALLSAIAVVSIGLARAATTERLVADRFTGLAISGVDPVGYFTDAGQRLFLFGRQESRAAFAADPGRLAAEARRRWPALRETLAR